MNMFQASLHALLGKNLIECRKSEDDIYGTSFWNIIRETRRGMTKGK